MNLSLKIGSRPSPLALVQVEEVLKELKEQGISISSVVIKYDTKGDRDKTTSLTSNPADNFFTDALDEALLNGEVDITIHSAKDLPKVLKFGLKIFALTKGLDDRDALVGNFAWKDLPHGAKIGTSSILRQTQLKALRGDIQIVDIRGTISERLDLVKQGMIDGVIVAACALKRLGLENQIKDYLPWEAVALQGQLAVVGRDKDVALQSAFRTIDVRVKFGHVILAGAGPGDPDLITVKAIKALERANCVFYDYLADKQLLGYARHAEHIYVGKRKGEHSMPQAELSRMLKEKALAGKNVVRLKGGDPLIFGRGAEEIRYLRDYHIQVDVIPGISSATAIPSSLAVPLTARNLSSSVAFVSAHEGGEESVNPQPIQLPNADTIVFLMGLTKLGPIVKALLKQGWSEKTPMMIIANGTRPNEQIVKATIGTIMEEAQAAQLMPPALIIVGKTVDLYQAIQKTSWLYCGTHPELYAHLGRITHVPTIEIKPATFDVTPFKTADIILCTSPYAVKYGVSQVLEAGIDLRGVNFAVIGFQTQMALETLGIIPAIIADKEDAQGLLAAIIKHMEVHGKNIVFPRSSLPNPFLKNSLSTCGARVQEVVVYENFKPKKQVLPDVNTIDGIIFTSPSTVKNFLEDYGRIPTSWQILAKGPLTLNALREAGYTYAASLS
jgi:uroporphyrinogen III methyltransferase/synthase